MRERIYTPDRWVVMEYEEDQGHAILAGWGGGYLDGPSWRRSSLVERVEDLGDMYRVYNVSGSVYELNKEGHGCTSLTAALLNNTDARMLEEEELGAFVDFYKTGERNV